MFPRRNRISRQEFSLISGDRTAKRLISPHFSVIVSSKKDSNGCSVVVAKKVAKISVARHLLKRRIRESVRPWSHSSPAFIVFARQGSPLLSFSDINAELTQLLSQLPK